MIVPVGPDGAAGAPTVIALDGFDDLAASAHPCAIWAPDGRWVAFGAPVRCGWSTRKPARSAACQTSGRSISSGAPAPTSSRSQATWAEHGSEAVHAGHGLLRVDRRARQLGAVEAGHLTWSPDGSTLAYTGGEGRTRTGSGSSTPTAPTNDCSSPTPATSNHGIGPVWSPTGDRIAYQRLYCGSAKATRSSS